MPKGVRPAYVRRENASAKGGSELCLDSRGEGLLSLVLEAGVCGEICVLMFFTLLLHLHRF